MNTKWLNIQYFYCIPYLYLGGKIYNEIINMDPVGHSKNKYLFRREEAFLIIYITLLFYV